MNDSLKVDPAVEKSVIKYLGGRKTPTKEAEIEKAFKGIDITKNEMEEALLEKGISLYVDDKAVKLLAEKGYSEKYGAREEFLSEPLRAA